MERGRVYGPGYFAGSQLSLTTNAVINDNTGVGIEGAWTCPTGFTKPLINAPGKTTTTEPNTTIKADYSITLTRLPALECSHYSDMSYEPTTLDLRVSFHPWHSSTVSW